MKTHRPSATHRNLLLFLLTFSTITLQLRGVLPFDPGPATELSSEDSAGNPTTESSSESEMHTIDTEKQSPPSIISKKVKTRLYLLSAIFFVGYVTAMCALAAYLEDKCEDYHYCVNKDPHQIVKVDSSITNCTAPYWQGSPAVGTHCDYTRSAVLTVFGGFGPIPSVTLAACAYGL